MGDFLRSLPALVWVAGAFLGIHYLTEDVMAPSIAVFCLVIAGLQLIFRSAD